MRLTKKTLDKMNKWLNFAKCLLILVLFLCSTFGCQTKCGNYAIFERCEIENSSKESFDEHIYETFKFKAPDSWDLEVSSTGEFVNYKLINEDELSMKENNIETFVITTTTVTSKYNFKKGFEKFLAEQYRIEDQNIIGVETFKEHQFENMAGIYISGTSRNNNMKYETLAICILEEEVLYWLNSTSQSENEVDINICLGKEIISTFETI